MTFSRKTAAASLAALCAALCGGLPLWAGEFVLPSQPSAVTIYGNAAIVTREVSVEVPQGQHRIILPDLPEFAEDAMTHLEVDAAVLRGTQFQTGALPERDLEEPPRIAAKRAELAAAEAALEENSDALRGVDLPRAAIEARQAYFGALWQNHEAASDVGAVKELAEMITAEVQAAQEALFELDQNKKDLAQARPELEETVAQISADLDDLLGDLARRSELHLDVVAQAAGAVRVVVKYGSEAFWKPEYAAYLDRDAGRVRFDRFVVLSNESGEPWTNAKVAVSTTAISDQTAVTRVRPNIRRIGPPPVQPQALRSKAALSGAVMVEAPVIVEEAAAVSAIATDLNVTYQLEAPVTLWPGSDGGRIALAPLLFEAEQLVRAAPRFDETAFLSAKFINDSAEPLLEGETLIYVDGALVGLGYIGEIPAGGEEELPFGPIPAVQVGFTLLDKQEGDAGVISRSNTREETARLTVENLGDRAYRVLVRDRVPVSEQEDLAIDWSARPAPDTRNVDDKRGVLEWEIDIGAVAKETITIDTEMRWPLDQVLR